MLTIKKRERGTMRAALITGSDDGEEAVNIAKTFHRSRMNYPCDLQGLVSYPELKAPGKA